MVVEAACEPAERELVVAGQVVASNQRSSETSSAGTSSLWSPARVASHTIEGNRGILAVAVAIRIGVDEVSDVDRDARLLADLPPEPGQGVLVLLEETAERVQSPASGSCARRARRYDRHRRPRAPPPPEARSRSARTRRRSTRPLSRRSSARHGSADRTASLGESPRGYRTAVSPRHVPASVTELTRVGLFANLPETLGKLADRMEREDVSSGTVLIREGEPGDRFFVLLSGVAGSRSPRSASVAFSRRASSSARLPSRCECLERPRSRR